MDKRKLLNLELGRLDIEQYKNLPVRGLTVVLDNVRSAHNIGSAFRTCDAFCADELILCGICATPPSAEIHKSALGAEDSVNWRYFNDTAEALADLKRNGYTVISVEQTINSVKLDRFSWESDRKYALVFGNEVDGVRQDVIDNSDMSLEIPQWGTKHSLNISVSLGVVLWHFRPRNA